MMYSKNHLLTGFAICLMLSLVGCKSDKNKNEAPAEVQVETAPDDFKGIDIVTRSMEFQTIDTLKSGWNTFRYQNLSSEVHFILFDKYPEGKSLVDTKKDIFPPFDNGMDLINQGKWKMRWPNSENYQNGFLKSYLLVDLD